MQETAERDADAEGARAEEPTTPTAAAAPSTPRQPPSPDSPQPWHAEEAPETVYDFCFDKPSGTWKRWVDLKEDVPIGEDEAYTSIIVPTVDTVRYLFLADVAIRNGAPILFCGPTGTGKSVYLQGHLNGMDKEKWAPANFVGFSAKTSANITQYLIDAKLDKRRKGFYGPPIGKKMVVMVDDLNMPQKETYGAQPPIELLRQWMDYGGWYDIDTPEKEFRTISKVKFCAAMGPPGGGRTSITKADNK